MFKLEEDNKLMAEDLEDKTTLVGILESEVKSKNIKLFLYGAGILIVGLIFGLSLRREKKRSKLYY